MKKILLILLRFSILATILTVLATLFFIFATLDIFNVVHFFRSDSIDISFKVLFILVSILVIGSAVYFITFFIECDLE